MIKTVQLQHIKGAFERETRTNPLLCMGEDQDGHQINFWLKLEKRIDIGSIGFFFETFTAELATQLGIHAAEPLAVEIHPVQANAQQGREWHDDLQASLGGSQSGSLELGDSYQIPSDQKLTTAELKHQALLILTLDCIAQNGDRTHLNPNMMRSRKQLAIF